MDATDRDALLTLMMVPGLGHRLIGRCIAQFGSAASVLSALPQQFKQIQGIGTQRATEIRGALDRLVDSEQVDQEKELIDRAGVSLLAYDDPGYPKLLRHIPDPPYLLYVMGRIDDQDTVALAVVGARKCTAYGREQADRLSCQCAQTGLCIVSGGAYGIDDAAHRAAIRAGGRTIAVLGSGLANPYPACHGDLYQQIADGRGAVISEFPMSTPPIAENFPRRNRIISGMALGVLVVEAAIRSGALITAGLCVDDHGRELMAIPGRVDSPASAGCHKIIREGWATLVTNVADVLDTLGETGHLLRSASTWEADRTEVQQSQAAAGVSFFEGNLSDSHRQIVESLNEPRGLDQIAGETGLTVAVLQADLTMLQIRGLVHRRQGLFARCR